MKRLFYAALCAIITVAAVADYDYNGNTYRGVDAGVGADVSNNAAVVAVGFEAGFGMGGSTNVVLIGAGAGSDAARLRNVVGIGTDAYRFETDVSNSVNIADRIVVNGNRKSFYLTPYSGRTGIFSPLAYYEDSLVGTASNIVFGATSNVLINAQNGKIVLSGEVVINGATFTSSDGTNITGTATSSGNTTIYYYGSGGGTTYDWYVATSGSDADYGTQDRPFRTIDGAISRAKDGDTICVLPGSYAWPMSYQNTQSESIYSNPFDISNKVTKIVSYAGMDKTFIVGSYGSSNVIHGSAVSDSMQTFEGFTFTGFGTDSGTNNKQIGSFSFCRFNNCVLSGTNDLSRALLTAGFYWCVFSNCTVTADVIGYGRNRGSDAGVVSGDSHFTYGCEAYDSRFNVRLVNWYPTSYGDTWYGSLQFGERTLLRNCYVYADHIEDFATGKMYSSSDGTTVTGNVAKHENVTLVIPSGVDHIVTQSSPTNLLVIGQSGTDTDEVRFATTNGCPLGVDMRPMSDSRYRLWGYGSAYDRALVKSAMRWYADEVRPEETRLVYTNDAVHVYTGATDLGTVTLTN